MSECMHVGGVSIVTAATSGVATAAAAAQTLPLPSLLWILVFWYFIYARKYIRWINLQHLIHNTNTLSVNVWRSVKGVYSFFGIFELSKSFHWNFFDRFYWLEVKYMTAQSHKDKDKHKADTNTCAWVFQSFFCHLIWI